MNTEEWEKPIKDLAAEFFLDSEHREKFFDVCRTLRSQALEEERKSIWAWLENDVGVSSKAIYGYMTKGIDPKPHQAPSDEWDRKRCVTLLQAAPEWVERLSELSSIPYWDVQIPLIQKALSKLRKV